MTNRQPRAVREAAQRADQLHSEIYPEASPDAGTPDEGGQAEAPPAAPAPEVPPVQADQGGQPAPVDAPPPAAPPAPPKEETLEFWKSKFSTLEGKYRAEVPRHTQALREANDRIQRLEQTLANMQTQPTTPPAGTNGKSLVTEEEVEEYGEDFVSMIRRVAQEEAGRAVGQVAPKIDEVRGELQKTAAQTALQRVYAQLDDQVKDWRAINKSQEFLDWLNEDDPFAGASRKMLLLDAFDRRDGHRVITFFNGFLNEQRTINPQPSEAPPQTPPARTQPKIKLEDFAGPRGGSNAGGPSASGSSEAPIQPWTRRQIAAFYKDVQLGVYKNDPARRDQIERSINRASVNGLVTP